MLPGENNVPPVRDGVPPIVENPTTLPQIPKSAFEPVRPMSPEPPMSPELPAWTGNPPDLRQQLPRPKFPQVGRIPQEPFQVVTSTRQISTLRPHAFYGEASTDGVTIWPGLLITYIEGSLGGTAVPEIWQPAGLTDEPLFISAGAGDIICLKFDVDGTTYAVSNVKVEPGTPGLVPAAAGGTCAVEIGTVTSTGFTQKLRSDFFYTSIYGAVGDS